ncbi:hypothetical protein NMG29_28365 [Streptomyces cocklensis]|uniref:hypothetical protein n=1 Tax=Actinacidiphila cocklensis TaxID=887465 RepID=UPI00203F6E4A|nr:hypothetical protein [Actinacidiphila cocklensis]MDD1062091.1 hypothetical protein [Actinacidiphila cocklensis]
MATLDVRPPGGRTAVGPAVPDRGAVADAGLSVAAGLGTASAGAALAQVLL